MTREAPSRGNKNWPCSQKRGNFSNKAGRGLVRFLSTQGGSVPSEGSATEGEKKRRKQGWYT